MFWDIAIFTFGACLGVFSLRTWQRRKLVVLQPKMSLLEARYEMLKTATRRPCAVMLGDSLTAGVPWSELTDCPSVANYGWNGDTTEGVLYRLGEIILMRPRAVFLMVGANDMLKGVPPKKIATNMREIVERLEAEDIAVVWHPILPFVGAGNIEAVNSDIYGALKGTRAKVIPLPIDIDDLRDGLHLGPSGARKWHDTIRPLLAVHCAYHAHYSTPDGGGGSERTSPSNDTTASKCCQAGISPSGLNDTSKPAMTL